MPKEPARSVPKAHKRDALERLYVLWIFSTMLFLLALVALVFVFSGRLAIMRDDVRSLTQRVIELERRGLQTAVPMAALAPAQPIEPPTAATQPTRPPVAAESPSPAPAAAALSELAVRQRLDECLRVAQGGISINRDADPEQLIADVRAAADRLLLSADVWARLALLARQLGRGAEVEHFLLLSRSAGGDGREFYEVLVAALLAAGRADEARDLAMQWVQEGGPALAALLLLETQLASGRLNAAHETADRLRDQRLAPAAALRYARGLMSLERWGELATILDQLPRDAALDADERDLLRAIARFHTGRLPDALAILEFQLEQRPDDYEVVVWHAAAIAQLARFDRARTGETTIETARAVLTQAAQSNPRRPEAPYWLAILESAAGRDAQADALLAPVTVAAPNYAPAWELRGALALNAGDLDAARAHLSQALAANNRRPSAHLLLAIAAAKAADRPAAEAALTAALRLDPGLIESARATEALAAMFTAAEMEAMMAAAASQPAAP